MTRRGRAAVLPSPGYEPPPRLIVTTDICAVDFYPKGRGTPIRFDFAALPVHRELQIAFAKAFDRRTGPSGTRRTLNSARNIYWVLQFFARILSESPHPPQCVDDIAIAHVDLFVVARPGGLGGTSVMSDFRATLLKVDNLPPAVRVHLVRLRLPPQPKDRNVTSYTRAEWRRIIRAARATVLDAAKRIRAGVEFLSRWQNDEIKRIEDPEAWERGHLLDYLAQHGDIPRYEISHGQTSAVVRQGGISALMGALFLTWREAAAACVLLICYTGINGEALASTTMAHERADSGENETRMAVIDVVKPRRGRRNRYMTVPLADLPAWTGTHETGEVELTEHAEIATSFGIFALLLELTEPARALCKSNRLFLWATFAYGGRHGTPESIVREGLPPASASAWGKHVGLTADPVDGASAVRPLEVTMRRLRLTHLQRNQRPVAQSLRTLADVYLLGDQGSILEYQRVVAQTLHEQEMLARQNVRALVMTEDVRRLATSDPLSAAFECGMTVETLQAVLDGRNDTLLAACVGFTESPHAPPGSDCTASFLICLSCPCARILPKHLPILLYTRDLLEQKRSSMTALDWANVYAGPHAQLCEVIDRFPVESRDAAQSALSESDRDLVQQLLNREWDLT